jgi:predicted HicB family RNase H-like nuclease
MNNLMEYRGYYGKIEYSSDDNVFFGVVEGIVDSVSFEGTNIQDLKKAFCEAVDDYLDLCERKHREPDKRFKGSFNVRVSPEIHKLSAIAAMSKGISLNRFVELSLKERLQSPGG